MKSAQHPAEPARLSRGVSFGTIAPWQIIFIEHRYLLFAPFLLDAALKKHSLGCKVLVVQAEEHVTCSSAGYWRDGKRQWGVSHAGDCGKHEKKYFLEEGSLPAGCDEIKARIFAQQRQEDEHPAHEKFGIDYIFDVPIDLAASVTGFRHDHHAVDTFAPMERKTWLSRFLKK